MANVSSSNGLEKRPKLRFPGFDEPWRAERLSDFADRVTRKNSKNETDLPLTISSKDGLVDQVSYFNKTVASKDMSGYYLLKNGEFAYNKSYSVGYDFGSIKRLDRYPMGALSTLYICFALKRHESDFIKAYFDSLKWYREIYMISAEGARNHGLLNVPTEEFFDTKHYLPENTDEQRKIADFLIALDRRIETQQSLVDNLKKYKRGVTRRLFAQEKGSFETNLQIVSLGDLFPFIRNGFVGTVTPFFTDREHGVRYLQGTNIHAGKITDDTVYYERIKAQERLVSSLKKYKRGVMQRIFRNMSMLSPSGFETVQLSAIFKKISRRNSNEEIKNVITNSAEYGLIPQRDFFDKDIAVDGNTSNYYVIEHGDFVYNPRKSNTAPYGPFNRYEREERGIISPLYTCLVLQADIEPSYLVWYFKSDAWYRYIYDNGSQGVRYDRVSMTDGLLMSVRQSVLPNHYEQQTDKMVSLSFLQAAFFVL